MVPSASHLDAPSASRLGHHARQLATAPRAFTTRRVPAELLRSLCGGDLEPRPGDLVLAEVERIGHHRKLHLADGRRRSLFRGDLVILAYGNRYASNQFEAWVPGDLGPCHLAAGGGVAARVTERHQRIRRGATRLQPVGLVTSGPGDPPLNVSSFGLPCAARPLPGTVPVFAVLGSALASGKTTAAAHLARGLSQLGRSVGYAKVTGTGAATDTLMVQDAGADVVLDFTDAGYVSTYGIAPEALDEILTCLVARLQHEGVEAIVLEVADGLLQRETAALLASSWFRRLVDGILVAARDAMSAVSTVDRLRQEGLHLVGLAGALEAAPLEVREAQATQLPFYASAELSTPPTAAKLLATLDALDARG